MVLCWVILLSRLAVRFLQAGWEIPADKGLAMVPMAERKKSTLSIQTVQIVQHLAAAAAQAMVVMEDQEARIVAGFEHRQDVHMATPCCHWHLDREEEQLAEVFKLDSLEAVLCSS